MRYMLLIYENETEQAARSGAEEARIVGAHAQVIEDLVHAGKLQGSDSFESTATASTVRVRTGKTIVTDGPFAETTEQLLGYCVVDARDLDDAIAIAARLPTARNGSVEIRPVREVCSAMGRAERKRVGSR